MEHWWSDSDRGKSKYSEETVPLPLCPLQIPHELSWVWTLASEVRGPWTLTQNHLMCRVSLYDLYCIVLMGDLCYVSSLLVWQYLLYCTILYWWLICLMYRVFLCDSIYCTVLYCTVLMADVSYVSSLLVWQYILYCTDGWFVLCIESSCMTVYTVLYCTVLYWWLIRLMCRVSLYDSILVYCTVLMGDFLC
jgi:hypothetical protein